MAKSILWRLHTASPAERIWALLATDEGRERFWAERSRSDGDRFTLTFAMGAERECRFLEAEPPHCFAFSYFRQPRPRRARARRHRRHRPHPHQQQGAGRGL